MNAIRTFSFAGPGPRLLTAMLAGVAVLLLSGPADGASVTKMQTHSGGLPIPDGAYAGPDGSGDYAAGTVAESTLTVDPLANDVITDLNVTVTLSHTYVGELTLKLRGPDDTTIFLINRPGLVNNDDGTDGGGGIASNFSTDYPITFDDEAPSGNYSENLSPGGDDDIVGSLTGTDNYIPVADLATPSSFDGTLGSFDGKSIVGDWTLIVGDSVGDELDTGALHSWELSATTVPAPGAATAGLAMMSALAGVGLLRRGRRRPGHTA